MARRLEEPASPSEASWKLAEYERHFNTIQAGLRGIASLWLLAAFGAIASVLTRDEGQMLAFSNELAIAAICAMGSTGVALLWTQDEMVYHRLLNALVVLGMKLEASDPDVPPIHAAMYASMPRISYEQRLSTFYNGPIAVLALVSAAALVSELLGSGLGLSALGSAALTAVPVAIFARIRTKSRGERWFFACEASRYADKHFDCVFARGPEAESCCDQGVDRILADFRPGG
jgi:hypothetical protein